MARVSLMVKVENLKIPSFYNRKPSEAFYIFREKLFEVINELPMDKASNRALKEIFRKEGKKKLKYLEKKLLELDSSSLMKRKVIYSSFYRIFQRLNWAENSESEREIELRLWTTASIDFLLDVINVLEEKEW
ncbi:MAG: hypothetical protein ABGX27_01390 [Desulfurobacteriaceae bacterium]